MKKLPNAGLFGCVFIPNVDAVPVIPVVVPLIILKNNV